MNSLALWKNAERPNYGTNVDREFPYSEVPHIGQYRLVKIPLSLTNLIDHVDYWGEGRIDTKHGISGFANCYNVNHTFQLVSNGPDKNRKIPNRIPVISYTDCDTSAYIKDNSVINVSVMGAPINSSCAKDIARMVNNDHGMVILYGFDGKSADVQNVTNTLHNKALYLYPDYKIPAQFQGLTLFNNHLTFLNKTAIKEEVLRLVVNGNYEQAVDLTKKLNSEINGDTISKIVQKLLESRSTASRKLLSFAYKLWVGGAENIVSSYFPKPFKLILGKEKVFIKNLGYNQALKLDVKLDRYKDRLAWGHNEGNINNRLSWQLIPVWSNNDLTFKLYNIDPNMYLKLDVTADNIGDRLAWGSSNSGESRHRYYVEPIVEHGSILFYIINYEYQQGLKLAVEADSIGDRLLWGHNGDIYEGQNRYKWNILAWTP